MRVRTDAELVGLEQEVFGVGEDLVSAEIVARNDAELLARLSAHVVQAQVLRWNAELRAHTSHTHTHGTLENECV